MAGVDDILNYKSPYITGGVLINKLGISDEDQLNKAERMITSYKLAKLVLEPGEQTFDVDHMLRIHRFLFEDIYPFAGKIRTEVISKNIPFCLPQYVFGELSRTLELMRLNMVNVKSRDELLKFITELYADLDIIHPFREGNGRTEREFLRQVIDYICKTNGLEEYYLDYTAIDDRDAFINAVVKADLTDYADLMVLFDRILVVKDKDKDKKLEV